MEICRNLTVATRDTCSMGYRHTVSDDGTASLYAGINNYAFNDVQRGKRCLAKAAAANPSLALYVGDFYEKYGSSLEATGKLSKARACHKLAIKFFRVYAGTLPAGAAQATAYAHVGQGYKRLSDTDWRGYSSGNNRRAEGYLDRALQLMPAGGRSVQIMADRFSLHTERFNHVQKKPRFAPKHFDQGALDGALDDLSVLLAHADATDSNTSQQLAIAAKLFKQSMSARGEQVLKNNIIASIGNLLRTRASSPEAMELQQTALEALEILLSRQPNCAAEAYGELQQFATMDSLTFGQLAAITDCYEALMQGNRQVAATAVGDLAALRRTFSGTNGLVDVLTMCLSFIKLHGTVDCSVVMQAIQETRLIGLTTIDREVRLYAIRILGFAAGTYGDIAVPTIAALTDVGLAILHNKNPQNDLALEVEDALGPMHNYPNDDVQNAVAAALLQLGSSVDAWTERANAREINAALPSPLPPSIDADGVSLPVVAIPGPRR